MLWDEDQKDHVKPYDGLNEQEVSLFIFYYPQTPTERPRARQNVLMFQISTKMHLLIP